MPNFEINILKNRFKATTWVHNEIATKDTIVKGTNNHAYINEIEKLSLETTKFTWNEYTLLKDWHVNMKLVLDVEKLKNLYTSFRSNS